MPKQRVKKYNWLPGNAIVPWVKSRRNSEDNVKIFIHFWENNENCFDIQRLQAMQISRLTLREWLNLELCYEQRHGEYFFTDLAQLLVERYYQVIEALKNYNVDSLRSFTKE